MLRNIKFLFITLLFLASPAQAQYYLGSGGGSLAAGGTISGCSNTQVLFNDAGGLGCSAGLTFTKGNGGTTSVLTIGGNVNLLGEAANTLAQRNGVNAQALRLYNTFTDASNNEYLSIEWTANEAFIRPLKNGTGVDRSISIGNQYGTGDLNFRASASLAWKVQGSSGHFLAGTDNTYDIGASGATRPRNVYVAGTGTISQMIITGITSDATHTDSTICQDTTTHQLYAGSGALGVCLGTSGRQFKTDFAPMTAGLAEITKLDLQRFRYREGFGDNGARLQYGLMAQDVEKVLPDLAGHNANGETINYDAGALLFVSIRAIQELNDKIKKLEAAK